MSILGRFDEIGFIAGALIGVLMFAIGLAFLVLALSVGMRRGTYPLDGLGLVLGVGGILLVAVGLALRLGYRRVPKRFQTVARVSGMGVLVLGLMAALFSASAKTTASAPFLITVWDKVVLLVTAFALILAGLFLLRSAGRMVGW